MRVGRERRSVRRRRAEKVHRRRIIILVAVLVAIPLLAAGVFAVLLSLGLHAVAAVEDQIPSLADQHQVSLAQTSSIYDADGNLLAYLHGVENRTVISGKQIPQVLRNADGGHRGRALLPAPGRGPGERRARPRQQRERPADHRGLLHHHHAARGQPLPRPHRHVVQPQVQRDGSGLAARAQVLEGRDPRPLSQHGVLRLQRLRGGGGGQDLLRQGARRAHPARGRAHRRAAAGAHRLLAAQAPGAGHSPAQPRDQQHAPERLHHRRRGRGGAAHAHRAGARTLRTPRCRSRTWSPTCASSSSTCSARRRCSRAACRWRPPSIPTTRSSPPTPSPPRSTSRATPPRRW